GSARNESARDTPPGRPEAGRGATRERNEVMSSKVPVDRATPSIPQPDKAEDIVVEGEAALAGVKASPHFNDPGAAEVQAKAKSYEAALGDLKKNNANKQQGRALLDQAENAEPALIRRAGTQRRGLSNSIEAYSDGSKDIALSFVKDLEERHALPDATV